MDKKERQKIEQQRREMALTNTFFNRYLLLRYSIALFFFGNVYWLLNQFISPSLIIIFPIMLIVFSILVLILGSGMCIYLLLYKKTEKNKWLIYFTSLVLFEISLFLVTILEKLNVFPYYLTVKIELSNNFLYLYATFSMLAITYVYLTFKKYYSKKL